MGEATISTFDGNVLFRVALPFVALLLPFVTEVENAYYRPESDIPRIPVSDRIAADIQQRSKIPYFMPDLSSTCRAHADSIRAIQTKVIMTTGFGKTVKS